MPELRRDSLLWAEDVGSVRTALGYRTARDAVLDPRGWTVRCTPMRRTVRLDLPASPTAEPRTVFAKHRRGRAKAALVEWRALERVAGFGFRAPRRVFLARGGPNTVIGSELAPGRPADVVIGECIARSGAAGRATVLQWIHDAVGPPVRAMHEAGFCYRDLYWNHLFVELAEDPKAPLRAAPTPTLIDAERLFAPERPHRWIVKDLAGLASSWPAGADPAPIAEMCEACGRAELADEVARKAAAIRGHRPKFG